MEEQGVKPITAYAGFWIGESNSMEAAALSSFNQAFHSPNKKINLLICWIPFVIEMKKWNEDKLYYNSNYSGAQDKPKWRNLWTLGWIGVELKGTKHNERKELMNDKRVEKEINEINWLINLAASEAASEVEPQAINNGAVSEFIFIPVNSATSEALNERDVNELGLFLLSSALLAER